MTSRTFPIDLLRADLSAIVTSLDSGLFTSEQLVQEYHYRINANNTQGKGLRAVSQLVNESECLAAAQLADSTRQHSRKGLLHGVPVLIKESIGTGPTLGLLTTGGTPALASSIPYENAPVVDSLLDAGMIILGKTNMTALGNYYQAGIPDGWSPLGGQVVSTFGVGVNPGGSSTGSAVALAAGMAAATIGEETMGSITCPANFNGIWGMKPTPGSVSNKGVIPINPQFDTIGPFGKTVGDVACLLDVLIPEGGFMSSLSTEKPNLSIGASSERLSHITSEEEDLFSQAQNCLSLVITTKDVRVPLHMQAGEADYANIMMDQGLVNAWDGYLKGVDGPMRSLRDVVEWHSLHPSESFHPDHPGQSLLVEALQPPSPLKLAEAEAVATQLKSNFKDVMDTQELDAIMYPWAGHAPVLATLASLPIVRIRGLQFAEAQCAAPFKFKKDGSPFGVIFVARPGAEATLLQVMATCEKLFPPRPVPDL